MAVKSRSRSTLWSLLHFVLRFIGVNGIFVIAVGLVMWLAFGYEEAGMIVALCGAGAVGLALLGEVRGVAEALFSHRGFAGVNAMLQLVMAAGLIMAVNYFSFMHHRRFDCTADKAFTLDENLRDRLAALNSDTDIIVYVPHVSFGQRVELRQDDYDQAAEKVITRRVEDLVEQFSQVSPRFKIIVYDTHKKNKRDIRDRINKASGETLSGASADSQLLQEIEKAPENSIFFYARDTKNLQRLSFNDLFFLDKKASEEANNGKGNLVLIDQGVRAFEDKIFRIEAKKPRITVAAVHGWLGQDGTDWFGMPGFKSVLASRGFEGRDVILWKRLQVEPGALDAEENRYALLGAKKARFEELIEMLEDETQEYRHAKKLLEAKKLDEFNIDFRFVRFAEGFRPKTVEWIQAILRTGRRVLVMPSVNPKMRDEVVGYCQEGIDYNAREMATYKKKLEATVAAQAELPEERLEERARNTNIRQKFGRLLADTDLLIVPRLTMINLIESKAIDPDLHAITDEHVEAIKDYIKSGKPVLFCLGPTNAPGVTEKDSLESMLADLKIKMPNQTVLFTSETEAMEERDEKTQMGGSAVDVPLVRFDWKAPSRTRAVSFPESQSAPPIRASMRVTARGFGDKTREALRIRAPRPVYLETWAPETVAGAFGSLSLPWPGGTSQALTAMHYTKYDDRAVILMTDEDCWNEERPLPPQDKRAPHFEKPKPDDMNNGRLQEKRKGPFPIGIALETEPPAEWYDQTPQIAMSALGLIGSPDSGAILAAATLYPRKEEPRKKARIAVIGDGQLLVGDKLSPIREKLFLDVANWLLERETLLARDTNTWEYPRVQLEPNVKSLWIYGVLGLPLVFVYIGLQVWNVRRMR